MRANTRCRSCDAPVRWVLVLPNLKRMPIDPEPDPEGNMWVERYQQGTPVMGVALNREAVPSSEPVAYVSHFVTCPQADEWRKR
ncbi:MAG TPA: hypothetical protein VLI04_13660 [Nocardioidaceae bacterium]|nr:hypothetical protein [Nocardioidaceae bacterium]